MTAIEDLIKMNKKILIIPIIFLISVLIIGSSSLKKLEVKVDETLYQYSELDISNLEVYENVLFYKEKVTGFLVDNVLLQDEENEINITYDGLKESLNISVIPLKEIRTNYTIDKVYLGDSFSSESLISELVYQDGNVVMVEDYNLKVVPVFFTYGENIISIETQFGSDQLKINTISIASIDVVDDNIYYSSYEDIKCNIIFDDGFIRQVTLDEIIDVTNLIIGTNSLEINYFGQYLSLEIDVLEKTNVMRAAEKYSNELEIADYSYVSDTSFTTITKNSIDGVSYYLSHVVINEPNQIKAGLAYDDYGGDRETVSSAMKRLGAVLGINASYFSYSTGKPISGVKIKNGQICSDSTNLTHAYYFEVCLTNKGELFEADEGLSAQDLLDKGVTDTFITADPVLINNGTKSDLVRSWDGYHYDGYVKLCRTTIGMVEPGEYYIVTATSGSGLGLYALQNIFYDKGCSYAQGLDGGGSSTLVFKGAAINRNDVSQRAVVDFIYFL